MGRGGKEEEKGMGDLPQTLSWLRPILALLFHEVCIIKSQLCSINICILKQQYKKSISNQCLKQ